MATTDYVVRVHGVWVARLSTRPAAEHRAAQEAAGTGRPPEEYTIEEVPHVVYQDTPAVSADSQSGWRGRRGRTIG